MNLATWSKKNFVAVAEEDLRENFEGVAAYIVANPAKVYLLPASDNLALLNREESAEVRFAREIEFPRPVTLITASKNFTVKTLSEMLELASANENFLVVSEDLNTANAIRRQCFMLQVPIKICSEKEFAALAAEQKLRENQSALLKELALAKKFLGKKSELKSAENVSLLEKFFAAAEKLERYLKNSSAKIKISIAGAQKECKFLAEGLNNLNFAAEIFAGGSYSDELQTCDALIFAVNISENFSLIEEFLRAVKPSPNREKIIFAAIRPALRDHETAINPSRRLFELSELLNSAGFEKNLIFFLDAPDVFFNEKILPLIKNNDEPFTPENLLNELALSGRDEFLVGLSLEKFFEQPSLPREILLKKSGIACLENFLRAAGQKNFADENLFAEVDAAFSFLDDDALKKIRLQQMQKIIDDERQAENSFPKISLIAAQGKFFQDETTLKAILFDADAAINDFVRAIEKINREISEKLVATEEFSSEKLAALHAGKFSSELKKLLADAEKRLQAEYFRLAEIFQTALATIIETHQARAKKFLENSSLPQMQLALPNFETGFDETFSHDNLIKLVNSCTEIFCVEETAADWNDFKAERNRLLKRFYLSGTFRSALRQNLEELARKKISDLEKNLRKISFAALVEYFGQIAQICKSQRDFHLNTFRKQTENISVQIDFLTQDFIEMEEINSALRELFALWRLIFTQKSISQPVDEKFLQNLSNEMLERKNFLIRLEDDLSADDAPIFSTKKFLPHDSAQETKSSSREDIFSAAKNAFRNKKYDNALTAFSRAAAVGHVEALKYLAYMNQNGLGTPQNFFRAFEFYLDAFRLGDAVSAGEIAELCLELNSFAHALEFYLTAADRGDKYSLEILES